MGISKRMGMKMLCKGWYSAHVLIVIKMGLRKFSKNGGKEGKNVFSFISDCFHLGLN